MCTLFGILYINEMIINILYIAFISTLSYHSRLPCLQFSSPFLSRSLTSHHGYNEKPVLRWKKLFGISYKWIKVNIWLYKEIQWIDIYLTTIFYKHTIKYMQTETIFSINGKTKILDFVGWKPSVTTTQFFNEVAPQWT